LIQICSDLKKRIWNEEGPDINGMIFRLHYKVTSSLLVFFGASLTLLTWFGSKPTRCISTSQQIEGVDIDTYCWVHPSNISTLPQRWTEQLIEMNLPGLGRMDARSGETEESLFSCLSASDPQKSRSHCWIRSVDFYQWTHVFFLCQALFFYLPRFVWSKWERGTMKYFLQTTHNQHSTHSSRAETAAEMIRYRSQRGKNKMYCLGYMLGELGMGLNLALQWSVTSSFIGVAKFGDTEFNFYNLGYHTLFDERGHLPSLLLFPRVTACSLSRYAPGNGVQTAEIMCLLPLNIINDKIFLLLWIWFSFLSVLTVYKLVYRAFVFLSPNLRKFILEQEISHSLLKAGEKRGNILYTAVSSHSDFLFLEVFNKNNDSTLVQKTLKNLWESED